MKTQSKYKTIVGEMAQVLSRHKLNPQEASYVAAMMFIGAVETDLKEYPDSQREEFCHRFVNYFYAEKRRAKTQIN